MDRFQELFKQGKLLFVGKVYPKYTANNKIRVFKPSSVLRVTLLFTALYTATRYLYLKNRLFHVLNPSEVIIYYPDDEAISPSDKINLI